MNLEDIKDKKDELNSGALTKQSDWDAHYTGRSFNTIERKASEPNILDPFLNGHTGHAFELGCGGSPNVVRCAMKDWLSSGIDYNSTGLNLIKEYMLHKKLSYGELIEGDVFRYDCTDLQERYDLLTSFGFLEHFEDPSILLSKWKITLKPDGLILSVIPNLFSVNAYLFEKLDPVYWGQHVKFTPAQMDEMHTDAGYEIVSKARYEGKYSIDMLTPWDKIEQKINNKWLYKLARYFSYFMVGKILQMMPSKNMRSLNPLVVGVYKRPLKS